MAAPVINIDIAIIGGGIAGCSTLFHLTQEGWSDVVLVERDELTSGTTWHSAAQVMAWTATISAVLLLPLALQCGPDALPALADCVLQLVALSAHSEAQEHRQQ